jgi:hypothetical protein
MIFKGSKLLLAFSLLLGAAPLRALDLTPEQSERILEGVHIPILLFHDPAGDFAYQPPDKWHYSGGGAVITFYPAEVSNASMKICVAKHARGTAEIATVPSADLAKWSQSYLPADAEDLKQLAENPNPFMLNGKGSRELIFSYKASGQRLQTSVAVLDWTDREHVVVVVTARSSDFLAVHSDANGSLFSWTLREPKGAAGQ